VQRRQPWLVVPPRPRRCLRALMMENESDTEAARKLKPSACRFQCVEDHAPPASYGGGAGNKNAEGSGKEREKEADRTMCK
jgi:hypothetical protein